MRERRQFPRIYSWLQVSYRLSDGAQALNSLTGNVSQSGLSLLTDQALSAGTEVVIKVKHADHPPVNFTASVVWSKPLTFVGMRTPRAFETGVRFLDIAPEGLKRMLLYTTMHPTPAVPGETE